MFSGPPPLPVPTQQDSRSLHRGDGGELNTCHVFIKPLLFCAVAGLCSHRLVLSGLLYFVVVFLLGLLEEMITLII